MFMMFCFLGPVFGSQNTIFFAYVFIHGPSFKPDLYISRLRLAMQLSTIQSSTRTPLHHQVELMGRWAENLLDHFF